MAYLFNLLISLDQTANALLAGSPDETLSSRAWRAESRDKLFGRFFRPLIDSLALLVTLGYDKNHCYRSYRSEVDRRQLPRAFQQ